MHDAAVHVTACQRQYTAMLCRSTAACRRSRRTTATAATWRRPGVCRPACQTLPPAPTLLRWLHCWRTPNSRRATAGHIIMPAPHLFACLRLHLTAFQYAPICTNPQLNQQPPSPRNCRSPTSNTPSTASCTATCPAWRRPWASASGGLTSLTTFLRLYCMPCPCAGASSCTACKGSVLRATDGCRCSCFVGSTSCPLEMRYAQHYGRQLTRT